MLLLDMAYRLLREFRQAFTRLDTPPFSNRRHPGSDIALGTIGGFEIKASGEPLGEKHYRLEAWLERHGYEQEIRLESDLTALGLIARLEYQLDRFEAELADYRRRVAEAEQRLPGYRRRVGEAFALQEELDAKAAELAALEADLAANTVAANDDAVAEVAAA